MPLRAARTAALLPVFVLVSGLVAACGSDGSATADRDATRQATRPTPRGVDHPPDYGVAALACDSVDSYVESQRYERTGTIRVRVADGGLRVTPPNPAVEGGGPVRWNAGDLDVTLRFMGRSPFGEDRMVLHGSPGQSFPSEMATVAPDRCGRYYYIVAAHDTATGRLYVADPPMWVY